MKRKIIPDIVNHQDIVALNKTASVHDAVQAMSSRNIAAVAVTDRNGLIGIITERDMTHRVLACGLNPQATHLSDVMTENPETLHANDDAHDAVELMLGRNIRHLPVVDDNGDVIAMVSMRDLLKSALTDLDAVASFERDAAFAPATV